MASALAMPWFRFLNMYRAKQQPSVWQQTHQDDVRIRAERMRAERAKRAAGTSGLQPIK